VLQRLALECRDLAFAAGEQVAAGRVEEGRIDGAEPGCENGDQDQQREERAADADRGASPRPLPGTLLRNDSGRFDGQRLEGLAGERRSATAGVSISARRGLQTRLHG
jgi:hypothetical protein